MTFRVTFRVTFYAKKTSQLGKILPNFQPTNHLKTLINKGKPPF